MGDILSPDLDLAARNRLKAQAALLAGAVFIGTGQ
jgi:hypothetical protein